VVRLVWCTYIRYIIQYPVHHENVHECTVVNFDEEVLYARTVHHTCVLNIDRGGTFI